jgi:acylphosphatase
VIICNIRVIRVLLSAFPPKFRNFAILEKMNGMKSVYINISGKVQGVGFRYNARKAAQRFGVKGYVRNQVDGTVYAEAEGEELAVDLFCEWCKKGPDWARVDRADIHTASVKGYSGFEIR